MTPRTAWLDDAPHNVANRIHQVLLHALDEGMIEDLSRGSVRAVGEAAWLRQPNLGPVSVRAIERLVGGWPDTSPAS
jgi:hypothetical protein